MLLDLSPVGLPTYRHSNLILAFNKYAVNVPQPPQPHFTPQPIEEPVGTQLLTTRKVIIVKYIDDNLICKKVNFGSVNTTISTSGVQTKE